LHSLVTTQFPQDAIEVIGFSDYAQVLRPEQLAGLDAQRVQGTNLQHALMLAGRFLAKHPDSEPVVLVVTDGEPTAHLTRDGYADFCWPPLPETLELTMAEVERITRRGATINVFLLDDTPALVDFVHSIAARNGGRVFSPDPDRLGEYVVGDYLRARRGRKG
ncbi:MAG: von Willebrand factor type, partial [Frankiales bacterium]|nr:von Willebrand factor type [Frankiales bacterium]